MTTVWVVAGAPGAGKTTVAGLLVARLSPPAALIDKDTAYGGFVAATLAVAGRPGGEREGSWYDENIKIHEYAGLAAVTREVRANGCPVVLVAPYTRAIRSRSAWAALVTDLGGEPVRLVWVGVPAEVLRQRLIDRASPRDTGKLAFYEAFVTRMRPEVPPPVPHLAIVNDGDLSALTHRLSDALSGHAGTVPPHDPRAAGPGHRPAQ
jgi:predicted kinase